jgi:hypothetical protein
VSDEGENFVVERVVFLDGEHPESSSFGVRDTCFDEAMKELEQDRSLRIG